MTSTSPERVPGADWRLLSRLVVRRTGFPFEWLTRLSASAVERFVAEAAVADQASDAAVREALSHFPAAVTAARADSDKRALRVLSRLRRGLAVGTFDQAALDRHGDAVPPSLRAVLESVLTTRDAADRADGELRRAYAAEQDRIDGELRGMLTDPLFAQALFLSNPDMYATSLRQLVDDPRAAMSGQLARRGWAYLQRFSGKNDTAAFFGPLNYASIVPDGPPIRVQTAPGRWRRRDIFLSFWAVRALADRIAADPDVRPWLRPRRHPLARLTGSRVEHPGDGREFGLPGPLAEIAALADHRRTTAEIAGLLGRPVDEVVTAVDKLAAGRVLIVDVDVPSTRFHPFAELRANAAALPAECPGKAAWAARLDRLEELRVALRDAGFADRPGIVSALDEAFTETTGLPARRGAGATYADRTLFYEDCEGTHTRFDFSREFADDLLDRLRPILQVSAAHAALLQRHYRRLGRAVLDEVAPGEAVPYARFAKAMLRRSLPSTDAAVEGLRERFADLVRARSDGHVATLTADDVASLLDGIELPTNCHVSPDMMVSARDLESFAAGDYQLILGEVHQVVYAWGSQLYFDDLKEESERECAAHVAQMPEYGGLSVVLTERRHKGLLSDAFPGTFVELSAVPSDRATDRVGMADLEVVADDEDGIVLRHRDTKARHQLYMAGDEQLHLWAVALPRVMPIAVRLPEGHTPRIELDRAVYQRERWTMPSAEWGADLSGLDDAGLLRRAARVREEHGMPRFCYLQAASEPKPYYVDFLTPLALRVLQQLAGTNEQLTFTEMLPDPSGLWLREDDSAYCCEFRMSAFRY